MATGIITFILNLQFIFRPNYWLMNDPYSEKWDKILNSLMDNHKFEYVEDSPNDYYVKLGARWIWIKNYPYACFSPYDNLKTANFRASRLTISRAKNKLDRELGPIDKYDLYK